MSALPKYRLDACESVDSAVFSGDMLHDPEQRVEFAEYLARWNKAMAEKHDPAERAEVGRDK